VAHNAYGVTKRDVSSRELNERVPRPLGVLITAVINVFASGLVAIIGPSVLESYRQLFAGFGAELPSTARFFLGSAWLWWLLAGLALVLGWWVVSTSTVTHQKLRRMKLRVRAFTLLIVLLISLEIFFV
jgi:hypothetical protein